MTWMASLARVLGASVPFGSSLVQISAELESRDIQARLRRLEDPISNPHQDVRELTGIIYSSIENTDESRVQLSPEEYERYRRPLAILEQNGHIRGTHSLNQRFIAGFWLTEPHPGKHQVTQLTSDCFGRSGQLDKAGGGVLLRLLLTAPLGW